MSSLLHRLPLLLVFATACDQTPVEVQHDYLDRHRDAFVFQVGRDKLVTELRALLGDSGLTLADDTGADLHSSRRADGVELSIHLVPVAHGGTLVHIVELHRDASGNVTSSARDEAREWELAQLAEPDRALAIMAAANDRADEVAPRANKR